MRKRKEILNRSDISILALDDDSVMTLTLQSYFTNSGYHIDVETDPFVAIERVRNGSYDILLLDFLMMPICGDQVVERIRQFNHEIFIILLTGHKDMAPPLKTIRELDIQGYYEKSDRFDQLELLVESCVKSIRQLRLIRIYQDSLSQMLECTPSLYRLQPIQELAAQVLSSCAGMYPEAQCAICLCPTVLWSSYIIAGAFPLTEESAQSYISLLGAQSLLQKDGCLIAALKNESQPLLGFICIQMGKEATDQQLQLFSLFVRQASAAIANAILHMVLEEKNQEISHTYAQLRASYIEMVRAMRLLVDAKDIDTRGHSDRVSYLATRLALSMGKDKEYVERVRVAGLFHDIGKIGVPDGILLKDSSLSDDEYAEIKQHPLRGSQILCVISAFKDIAPIIEQHHERLDGSGYPRGLKGEEICEEARIISVVDAFDAMTSQRKYQAAKTFQQAREQLIQGSGTQFDAEIVQSFLRLIEDEQQIIKDMGQATQPL